MVQPLALVVFEKLLPGSQLVNRLQDLGYRTATLADIGKLAETVEKSMPMIALVDMQWRSANAIQSIQAVKLASATSHLPIIAFGCDSDPGLQGEAESAGAIVTSEAALNTHLPQLLDRALQI